MERQQALRKERVISAVRRLSIIILATLALFIMAGESFAYRSKYVGIGRDGRGNVIESAIASIYLAGTSTAATIYTSETTTTGVNTVTTESDGTFTFYVDRFDYDSDQQFKITVVKSGYTTQSEDYVAVGNVVAKTYTIAADKTVTTALKVPKGVVYSVSSGVTLTFNGTFEAGLDQVFSGTGTVAFGGPNKGVNYEWFPATAAGFASAVAATPIQGTLHMHGGSHSFSTTLTINRNIGFVMENDASITSSAAVALDLTASFQRVKFRFAVARSTDWTAGNFGVRIADMIDCEIDARYVVGFNTGLYFHCTDPSASIYFNKIWLGQIYSNQIGVKFHGNTGIVNANRVFGGRFSVAAAVQPTLDRYGIVFENAGTNICYSPGIELEPGSSGGIAYATAFLGDSKANRIIEPYIEAENYVLTAAGTSRHNKITGHFTDSAGSGIDAKILDTSSYPGTNIVDWTSYDNVSLSKGGLKEVFPVTDVFTRAIVSNLDGADRQYIIPGFTWCYSSSFYAKMGTTNIDLADTYLRIEGTWALGRKVDTTVVKKFWAHIEKATAVTATLRVVVVAFDADGARLSGGTHIQGLSGDTDNVSAFATTTDFGNAYICNVTSTTNTVFFKVASTVKSIWVGVISGPASVVGINAFSLKTDADRAPTSTTGLDLVSNGAYSEEFGSERYSLVSPIGGILNNGTRVWHLDAASGEAIGWMATGRVSTLANGGEPAAETDVIVDSITGVVNGDIMGVMLTQDTTLLKRWWWTSVNGVPADLTLVMAHAVPTGYTIADNAKVITYRMLSMGALP